MSRIPIKLALSLPSYDGRRVNAIPMLTVGQAVGTIHYMTAQGSLLAHVFNRTLCEARQKRDAGVATHFCMLHADIAPEADWFQKLWAEYIKRSDAEHAERARDRAALIDTLKAQADASAERTALVVRAMTESSTAVTALSAAVRDLTTTVRDIGERVSRLERADSERIPRAEVPLAR